MSMRSIMLSIMILVILGGLNPGAQAVPDEAVGRVVSVISADSLGIEMQISDPRTRGVDSIRLADILAPSTVTAEGKAAQKAAELLLKNQTVYIDIDDSSNEGRNEWGQLVCVIYLMDSRYRPIWPPVNRRLVDEGHAYLAEDNSNEFDSSAWWKDPIPQGSVGNMLRYKEIMSGAREAAGGQDSANKSSVLEMSSAGRVSIGYRT
jgi:endonuclease YncB( thermonuclease family)